MIVLITPVINDPVNDRYWSWDLTVPQIWWRTAYLSYDHITSDELCKAFSSLLFYTFSQTTKKNTSKKKRKKKDESVWADGRPSRNCYEQQGESHNKGLLWIHPINCSLFYTCFTLNSCYTKQQQHKNCCKDARTTDTFGRMVDLRETAMTCKVSHQPTNRYSWGTMDTYQYV